MFFTGDGTFSSDSTAVLFALLLLVLPALAGAALGLLLARAARGTALRVAAVAAVAGLTLAAAIAVTSRADHVSVYDTLLAAGALLTGVVAGASMSPKSLHRNAMLALAGLLLGELALRVVYRPAGVVPPPRAARLSAEVTNRDESCNVMFPSESFMRGSLLRASRGSSVLHIGDSMVAGAGVPRERSFVSLLDASSPGEQHVNLGASGAGPEVYLLALRRWGAALRPSRALVYLFVGNDLFDLDTSYLCCTSGGMLLDDGERPRARCPTPTWRIPVRMMLATSPPPFSLRALATVSRTARLALDLSLRAQATMVRWGFANHSGTLHIEARNLRWTLLASRVRAIATAARDLGVSLTFVVLPHRQTLEVDLGLRPSGNNPLWPDLRTAREGHRRFVSIARDTGVEVLDGWDLVRDAMVREGAGVVFAEAYPGDVHFSIATHARVAAWLRARGYGGITTQRAPPTQLSPGPQH